MKNKLRPLGQITNDLEKILCEMVDTQEMQLHEILGVVLLYIQSHRPDAIEVYEDGSSPILSYGPKDE